MILKTKVEHLTKDSLNRIDDMMHHRQTFKYKLDNEIRCKEEIVIEQKKETLEKEHLRRQLEKLKTLNNLFKSKLKEKIAEEQILRKKICETQEKYSYLETHIIKISKELALLEINNDIILQWEKKVAVIKNLKESFSGVVLLLAEFK